VSPYARCITTTDSVSCIPSSAPVRATACTPQKIRRLLEPDARLQDVLRRQRDVLFAKRHQLDKAITAINNARRALDSASAPDWKLFQLIVKEFEMQNSIEWKGKYFSNDAKGKVRERQKL
jgi:hypothetical protein